jgi:hypothetical protein
MMPYAFSDFVIAARYQISCGLPIFFRSLLLEPHSQAA